MSAGAFDVENDFFTELPMTHPGSEADSRHGRLLRPEATDRHRARNLHTRANLFDQLFGGFLNEPRRRAVTVDPMETTLLGIGQEELLHSARHSDVTQPPLFLQTL